MSIRVSVEVERRQRLVGTFDLEPAEIEMWAAGQRQEAVEQALALGAIDMLDVDESDDDLVHFEEDATHAVGPI